MMTAAAAEAAAAEAILRPQDEWFMQQQQLEYSIPELLPRQGVPKRPIRPGETLIPDSFGVP